MSTPDFSIVTPSFRMSSWLRLCVASVADQEGVTVEHLVQDAESDDGTREWLSRDARVDARFERDGGMYDGINRGLRRTRGRFVAYLNCDEQLLPGALLAVRRAFEAQPEVDVLVGDVVIVDGKGELVAFRKVVTPRRLHVLTHYLPIFSCAMFVRRHLFVGPGEGRLFDTRWKDDGDAWWVAETLAAGKRFGTLGRYTSAFTDTGENRGTAPNALREHAELVAHAPWWARRARRYFQIENAVRRLRHGCYWGAPDTYAIYTRESPDARRPFSVSSASPFWR